MRNLMYSGVAHKSPVTKQMCILQIIVPDGYWHMCAQEYYDKQTWVYIVVDNWTMYVGQHMLLGNNAH